MRRTSCDKVSPAALALRFLDVVIRQSSAVRQFAGPDIKRIILLGASQTT